MARVRAPYLDFSFLLTSKYWEKNIKSCSPPKFDVIIFHEREVRRLQRIALFIQPDNKISSWGKLGKGFFREKRGSFACIIKKSHACGFLALYLLYEREGRKALFIFSRKEIQMKHGLLFLSAFFLVFGSFGMAFAVPFPSAVQNDIYDSSPDGIPTAKDNNDGIPDINDAINLILGLAPNDTGYMENNEDVDDRFVEPDYVWGPSDGGEITILLIGLTAGNSNTLGFYSDLGIGDNRTSLLGPISGFGFKGKGTAADPFGYGTTMSLPSQFGWYLQSNNNLFFSEPGLNTQDNLDHMMTFSLPELNQETFYYLSGGETKEVSVSDAYLLAWEDLMNGGDNDYDDMMYLVANVAPTPTPEPGTVFLLGSGLFGLVVYGRKRKLFRK
jgi:hypothetical protein